MDVQGLKVAIPRTKKKSNASRVGSLHPIIATGEEMMVIDEEDVDLPFRGLVNVQSLATYTNHTNGPMAMIYNKDLGWVDELIGPKTRYWNALTEKNNIGPLQAIVSLNKKRIRSSPLQELDPNSIPLKRSKGKQKVGQHQGNERNMDGGVAEVAKQPRPTQ